MDELILLQDSPGQRGEQLGLCQKQILRERVEELKALCARNKVDTQEIQVRARSITSSVNILVPEWVLEIRAAATVAQVPAGTLMAITSPPERVQPFLLPKRTNDSSGFVAACPPGGPFKALLLENCDGPHIDHIALSRAASPGTLAYVAVAEAADLGLKAFVNSAGLAGSFHVGNQVEDFSLANGIPPSLVLRQICERATSCSHALAEFEALQRRVGTGTPDRRGVIYFLADSSGDVMLLETGASRYNSRRSDRFFVVVNKFQIEATQTSVELHRQRTLRELLSKAPASLPLAIEAACNDESAGDEKGVCDMHTRASFVAALGQGNIPGLALATIGSPLLNLPIPLFPGVGVPRGLLDGKARQCAAGEREKRLGESDLMETRSEGSEAQRIPAATRAAYQEDLLRLLAELDGSNDTQKQADTVRAAWALARQHLDTAAVSAASN